MFSRLRSRLSYANVIATLALLVMLCLLGSGFTSVAAAAEDGTIVFTRAPGLAFLPVPTWLKLRAPGCKKRILTMERVRPDGSRATALCVNGTGGTISPDGKHLAFIGLRDANRSTNGVKGGAIETSDLHGKHIRVLTRRFNIRSRSAAPINVVWSPTGHAVAVETGNFGSAGFGLYVISVPQGRVHEVLSLPSDPAAYHHLEADVTWSPDGQTLAVDEVSPAPGATPANFETISDVVEVPAAGGPVTPITHNPDIGGPGSRELAAPIWGKPGIAMFDGSLSGLVEPANVFGSEVLADGAGNVTRVLATGLAQGPGKNIGVGALGPGAWSPTGATLLATEVLPDSMDEAAGLATLPATGGPPTRVGRVRIARYTPVSWGR